MFFSRNHAKHFAHVVHVGHTIIQWSILRRADSYYSIQNTDDAALVLLSYIVIRILHGVV